MSDLLAGITTSIKSTANAITKNEYVRKVTESMWVFQSKILKNDWGDHYPLAKLGLITFLRADKTVEIWNEIWHQIRAY